MSKTTDWAEIMNLFRGVRLQVHTDLADGVPPVLNLLNIQEALGWLVYHRLVWHDGQQYVARTPREARDMWVKEGFAKLDAANVARSLPMPQETPEVAVAAAAREVANFPTGASDAGEPAAATPHQMRPGQGDLFT